MPRPAVGAQHQRARGGLDLVGGGQPVGRRQLQQLGRGRAAGVDEAELAGDLVGAQAEAPARDRLAELAAVDRVGRLDQRDRRPVHPALEVAGLADLRVERHVARRARPGSAAGGTGAGATPSRKVAAQASAPCSAQGRMRGRLAGLVTAVGHVVGRLGQAAGVFVAHRQALGVVGEPVARGRVGQEARGPSTGWRPGRRPPARWRRTRRWSAGAAPAGRPPRSRSGWAVPGGGAGGVGARRRPGRRARERPGAPGAPGAAGLPGAAGSTRGAPERRPGRCRRPGSPSGGAEAGAHAAAGEERQRDRAEEETV